MITSSATSQISAKKNPPLNTLLKLIFSCLELARWLILCGLKLEVEAWSWLGVGWGNSSWPDLCWILCPIALSCCVVSNAEHNCEAWSGEGEAFSKGKTDSSLPLVTFVQFFFLLFGGVGVFWISRDFNGKWLHHVFLLLGNAQDCWMDDLHTQKKFTLLHLYYSYW